MRTCFGLFAVTLSLTIPCLAAATGACAVPAGGGSVQTMDSWVVMDDQVVENRTIRLNGMLDIRHGTLTLRNVALEINSSAPMFLRASVTALNVGPGAGLVVANSRISAAGDLVGVINAASASRFSVENTCFQHAALWVQATPAPLVRHNEFVLMPNCRISAISVTQTDSAVVEDNSVRLSLDPKAGAATGSGGVLLRWTHHSSVLRNTIIGTTGGIGLTSAWNNHIAENTWHGPVAVAGFDTLAANWWSLSDQWASHGGIGIDNWSNNNVIEKNTFLGSQSATLFIAQSANNTVSQNKIKGAGYGIALRWASNNLVDNNELTDVYDNAIHAHRSHDNTITNNRIFTSGGGVGLYSCEGNSIKSNTVADSERGIFLHESGKNTIEGNTVSGAVQGLFLASFSRGNRVTGNNIVASDEPAWDDSQDNNWKGNFWGVATGAQRAIPPAAAADGGPATSMLPLVASHAAPLATPPFNGPLNAALTITNQQVWQDARTMNKSIVIESGGNLTLARASLTYVVPEATADIWIHVKAGGSLTIEDSKIVGPQWDHPFAIKIYEGGKFTMRRSEVQNAGSWVGTFAAAIANEGADDVLIENSTFTNVYCAYAGEGRTIHNFRFLNNTINGAVKALALISDHFGAEVAGNHISHYGEWGIDFASMSSLALSRVTDNTFSDGWGPAIFKTWNAEGYEVARNACTAVRGPCQLIRAGGGDFRQIQTAATGLRGGPGPASVLVGNVSTGPDPQRSDANVFPLTLSVAGTPVQTRHIALPLGHFGRIKLTGAAAEAAYEIVIGAAEQPAAAPSKTDLRFAAAPGTEPPPQVVRVTKGHMQPTRWVWTATSDSPWLHATPEIGAGPSEISVTTDASKLAPGIYDGAITISVEGQAPETVTVRLTVTSDVPMAVTKPAALSFVHAPGGTPSQVSEVSLAPGGQVFPISVSVRTNTGGNWLSAATAGTAVPSPVSVAVDGTNLAPGRYIGEVIVSAAGAANSPLSIPVTLTVPSTGPGVSIAAVVNGASFLPGFSAPSWLTITGANLSRTTRTWAASDFAGGRLPESLDGVRVTIDDRPASIYYVSPTQLNVLVPFGSVTLSDSATRIQVTAPDGTARYTALQRRYAPGVFVFGGLNAAAIHTDGTLVCAEGSVPGATCRPAKPGDWISLYATGLGSNVHPPPEDGRVIQTPSVLSDPVEVTVGGSRCTVQYQGLVGAGLYQINLQIPDVTAGEQPVLLSVGGASSQAGPFLSIRR